MWLKTVNDDVNLLIKNNAYELARIRKQERVVGCKFLDQCSRISWTLSS